MSEMQNKREMKPSVNRSGYARVAGRPDDSVV